MSLLRALWDGSSWGQDTEGELDKELLWKVEAGSDPRGAKLAGEGGIGEGMLGMLREEEQPRGATFPVEGDDDGKPAPKKRLLFAVQAVKLHTRLPENGCMCVASQAMS